MSVEEALKLVISGGAIIPQNRINQNNKFESMGAEIEMNQINKMN